MDPLFCSPGTRLLDDDEINLLAAIDPRLLDYDRRNMHFPSPKANDTALPEYHQIHSSIDPPPEMDALLQDDEMHPLVASPNVVDTSDPHQLSVSFGPPYTTRSNITAPSDLLNIRRCIREFISSIRLDPSSLPNMTISPVNLKCFRALKSELNAPEFGLSKEADSFSLEYSAQAQTLIIFSRPSPPHDTMPCVASDILGMLHQVYFLSAKERNSLVINVGNEVAMPGDPALPDGMRHSTVLTPDAAYSLSTELFPPELTRFPRVVFEVGYSQSYESLKESAREWLLRGQGLVKLVVVIKLIEGRLHAPKKIHQKRTTDVLTNEDRHEAGPGEQSSSVVHNRQLDEDWDTIANLPYLESIAPQVEEPNGSFEDLYRYDLETYIVYPGGDGSWMKNDDEQQDTEQVPATDMSTGSPIDTSPEKATAAAAPQSRGPHAKLAPLDSELAPFVGPITGYIELYRFDVGTGTVHQDGIRHDLFHVGGAGYFNPVPLINVTDLLPLSSVEGDPSRSFTLPIDFYRSHIEDAANQLGICRRQRQEGAEEKRKLNTEKKRIRAPEVKRAAIKKPTQAPASTRRLSARISGRSRVDANNSSE